MYYGVYEFKIRIRELKKQIVRCFLTKNEIKSIVVNNYIDRPIKIFQLKFMENRKKKSEAG